MIIPSQNRKKLIKRMFYHSQIPNQLVTTLTASKSIRMNRRSCLSHPKMNLVEAMKMKITVMSARKALERRIL